MENKEILKSYAGYKISVFFSFILKVLDRHRKPIKHRKRNATKKINSKL